MWGKYRSAVLLALLVLALFAALAVLVAGVLLNPPGVHAEAPRLW